MANRSTISSTTQQFLDIYDITSDIVIMKDGSTSLILTVNAINFGLLAEEEQDGIIYSYAGLLNSLNYNVQILITSQTKDVSNYLYKLEQIENETVDRKRKLQINEYRQFVTDLIQDRNVLDKKFYVVIPANSLEMGMLSAQSVLPGVKNPDISSIERSVILEKAKTVLEPKRDHLIGQFGRIGLYARQLETQEIIQLFYNRYNPEASDGQKITDSRAYTTPVVEARIQGVTMTDNTSSNAAQPAAPTTTTNMPGNTPAPVAPSTAQPPAMPVDKAKEVISGDLKMGQPEATPQTNPSAIPPAPVMPAADAQAAINTTLQEIGGSEATASPTTPPAPAAPTPQMGNTAASSSGVSVPPKPSVSATGGSQPNAAMPPLPEI